MDQISDILFVCQVYAKQYSKERVVRDDSEVAGDRVLKQIPPLYAIVLKFSYQTRKLVIDHGKVGKSAYAHLLKATHRAWLLGRTLIGVFGGEFGELENTVNDAKEKRNTLQGMADIAFKAAAIGILEGDSKVLDDVHEAINAVMIPDLKVIQVKLTKNREHEEKKDLEKACQENKAWLLPPGTSAELEAPEKQYLANLKHRHPGTCRWILRTQEYEMWRDQETPSLLHLLGEGGYGKSYLVSTIIEDLKNSLLQQVGSKCQLVYFFCKSGDNATQNGVKIMLHLVAQLFTACVEEAKKRNDNLPDQKAKYQKIIDVLKNARDKIKNSEGETDSSRLQINSALQPMFIDLAEVINTRLFVIVDALDECSDLTAGFLAALKALPNLGIDIRVLVSSRPEDQIANELGDAPYHEIEVNKEKNHADVLAYIEESLKNMPRFRGLNVGPRIAKKSDGMFKCKSPPIRSSNPFTDRSVDANMVIESLKQSKAVRTNVQQLMKRLPDGMNNLYKQKLQNLEEDDRAMLLIALRWLMCSEGRIEIALVADDIEHCYEDLGHDDDNPEYEDSEDSDSNSAVIGVSTGTEAQETGIDYRDRESIKRLKAVGRDFLKFSSAVVDIQHKSVRDFVHSEEKSLPRDPRICPECIKRLNQDSTYQASPKYGHLIMVENIFRKLMSPSFQNKFIIIRGFERDMAEAALATSSPGTRNIDALRSGGLRDVGLTPEPQPDAGIEGEDPKDSVDPGVEQIEVGTQPATEGEEANSTPDVPDFESGDEEPPRYELEQWPRHLRAAEEAWPAAERDVDLQRRWDKLYINIEKFLYPESFVFRCWSKRLSLWGEKPLVPLHVAANFGLLGMMQRYISYGIDVDVLDEDEWTPLHFTCWMAGNNIGIELLVQHGANVNALTNLKLTPLLLLATSTGSPKLFQYLLDHGAKPEISDSDGWTCLHHAAQNRNLELCSILLGCTTVDINAKDKDGETPLHWMFKFPNASYELVKLFLDHGSNVNEQNKESQGPLYAACLVGNVAGAQLLLEYEADIDDDEDVFGRTALHAAVEASNLELVKLLVEKDADVYRQDKKGRDCLAQAADENEVEILRYLLKTWKSEGSLSRHLLTHDLDGDTPLHRSAAKGNEEAIGILLEAGDAATMCSQSNHSGLTPLHMAAYSGSPQIVEILLNNGADPIVRSNQGLLPLDSAFQGWKNDYNSSNGCFVEISETLARISPDAAQKADILDLAVEKGAIELSEALAKVTNTVDVHGWTPKRLADCYERHEIASILLQDVYPNTVENPSSAKEADFVRSPSRWSTLAKHSQLTLSEDGLEVACLTGKIFLEHDRVAPTDLR